MIATARRLLTIVFRVLTERDSFKLDKHDIMGVAEPPSFNSGAAKADYPDLRLRGSVSY
jgi:hypothetical protein